MPWPPKIIKSFEIAESTGVKDESRFYGPYNTLLTYLFPFEEDFQVAPQYKRPRQSRSVDFTTIFIVSHGEHPVFFVEIKASSHIEQISTRADADKQMRERINSMFDSVKIDTLYGISALGTRLCVYKTQRESGDIEPQGIADNLLRVTDTAPLERWNLNLLDGEGEKRVREIVAHIKETSVSCHIVQNWKDFTNIFRRFRVGGIREGGRL
ncbi:hypothetical protein B9Z19DRAFT_1004379 [Tuber borchii]|uniref:Type I restriction enzyme R protein N-terminal domain-containing protein n=1 Tax=Tuber borchii TaxID=42251 RepID=A0A2T6ZDC4_TUBBO|nr:hypothetical protein B9Z19DRAFT_1004379 [Tuber borchii]